MIKYACAAHKKSAIAIIQANALRKDLGSVEPHGIEFYCLSQWE